MDAQVKTRVIDADAHVIETEATWDYLEPADAKYRPVLSPPPGENPAEGGWMVDGVLGPAFIRRFTDEQIKKMSETAGRNMNTRKELREMTDIPGRLAHMDELGIDIQVLFPTMWLTSLTEDPKAEAALARSYNSWLIDIWKQAPERLRWVVIPPTLAIDETIEEIRRAKKNGAVGVFIRAFEGDRLLSDPYFYPMYEEAERLDMPMTVHIANGSQKNTLFHMEAPGPVSVKGFTITRVPAVVGCMALLMSDVYENFPKLRWGFIESAAQWVPWVYNEFARRVHAAGEKMPADLFGERNIHLTCQSDDDLAYVLKYSGPKSLLIGTDYGHTDPSAQIDVIDLLHARTDIDDTTKQHILYDNPKRLYGL